MIHKPKLVQGVGVNDADYPVCPWINGKQVLCPFYKTWQGMLVRAYSPKLHTKRPTYVGSSVCAEWLRFSNFKSWMEQQDWVGKQLDKDLLVQGNKIYGPSTCLFVTSQVNLFLIKRDSSRGEWPIGVCFNKRLGKFHARVNSLGRGYEHLGYYGTPQEAHQAWLTRKRELSVELASKQTDHRISDAILQMKYEHF